MKNIVTKLILLTAVIGFTNCSSGSSNVKHAVINGTIENGEGKTIFLEDVNGSAPIIIDTAIVKNKKIVLGTDVDPGIYRIRVNNLSSRNPALFFLNNESKVSFTFDIEDPNVYTAKGNKESELISEVLVTQAAYFKKVEDVKAGFAQGAQINGDSLNAAIQNVYKEANEYVKKEISDHQNLDPHANALLLNLLNPQSEGQFILAELQKCLDKNDQSQFIKSMGQRFGLVKGPEAAQQPQQQQGLAIGEQAPEIDQPNTSNKNMSLEALQGKYVLVDFWASWCKPCRMENPNVVKTYKKYKNKGFEIYSVSLDRSKDRWIKAIEDDGLIWEYHVSDLAAWSSLPARDYGVRSIPATFLLDPEGKIIAKNLRGPALEAKLAEVLGK